MFVLNDFVYKFYFYACVLNNDAFLQADIQTQSYDQG